MRVLFCRIFLGLFCLLLGGPIQASSGTPLQVGGAGRIPLAGYMEMLQDPSGTLSLHEITATKREAFKPVRGNVARGYGCPTLWLRFTLQGSPGADPNRLLAISAPFLQKISLFTPQADGSYLEQLTGASIPQALREGRFRRATFPIDLGSTSAPRTYYLKVVSRTTMVVIPILWRATPLQDALLRESLFYGGFFGVAFVILLAHLLYWVHIRESVHLHYACYVATTMVLTAANTGHIRLLFTPGFPWVQRILLDLSTSMVLAQGAALFAVTVRLRELMPRTERLYTRIAWTISLISVGASLVGWYLRIAPILGYCLILMADLNMVLAVYLAWRGERSARLYLLAFGPVVFSSTAMLGSYLSILPAFNSQELVFSLSSIFHVLLMNAPIAYNMQRLKLERNTLRDEALLAAVTHRKELEDRVASRTLELRQEKAQVELALDSVNQMAEEQQRLIQTISHEFRTPLAVIDGASQLLVSGSQTPQRIREQIRKIRKGTRRLIHLLDNSLHQDRIASGAGAFKPRSVLLDDVMQAAITQAQALAEHHRIDFAPSAQFGLLECDPEWLTIALRNLLDNAVKYSPLADTVQVSLTQDATGELTIEISDQGIGIPKEQLNLVFNRYFRGRNVGTIPGVGLGLDLVQQIIHHHRGRIEVKSQMGQGTTFRVILPGLHLR